MKLILDILFETKWQKVHLYLFEPTERVQLTMKLVIISGGL